MLASLMLTLFLAALDSTIVNTALPTIARDLHGFDRYTWPSIAYLLTSTTMIPIVGKLSDQFGRKWFLMSGVVIFLLGSALCGATPEIASALNVDPMNLFIFFRGFQGIGGGMLFSLVFTSIGDIFPPAERARWQGLFSGVFGLASVFGPTAGGYITDTWGWQWIFYINLPLGIIALILLFRYLPADISTRSAAGLGWAGVRHRLLGRGDGRWSHGLPGIWFELGRQARAFGLRLELAAGHWHPGGGGDSVPRVPRHRALRRGGADSAAGPLQEPHLQGWLAACPDGRHGALRARSLSAALHPGGARLLADELGYRHHAAHAGAGDRRGGHWQVIARVGRYQWALSSAHVC